MRTLTQSAQAAKIIRKVLKKEYPQVKFKVRSENYSMGSSVNVSWEDGIPEKELKTFLGQFQYGHFDGMQDLYEISNPKDFPQAKFIFGDRSLSEETRNIIKEQLAQKMGIEPSEWATIPKEYMVNVSGYGDSALLNSLVHQISVDFDFTKGFNGVRTQKTEDGKDIVNMFELY